MLTACARLNHDPNPALADAQIQPHDVLHPDARITSAQMEKLSDRLMRDLDDEALGWFHRRLPWGSYGMLARASITAPTLKVAIKRWVRHHRLLTDDIAMELSIDSDGMACISLTEIHTGPWLKGELREFCHVSMLRNIMGLASWLVDSHLALTRAEFAFATPPHASTYGVLFGSPCMFGQPCTRIYFSASYLQLPLRRDEAALRHMLQRALPLTVRTYRKDRLLVERVRQLFKADPSVMRHADLVADRLHLSTRTLHRQLREQGTTLQALKNNVRMELATDLLQRTQMPIKQIALAVGFDNDKGFIRAYKTNTGISPGDLRPRKSL